MELHFIILTVLCSILLLFILLAIFAYCCGAICCGCGNSSYSHSREAYSESFTTGSKTATKRHSTEYISNNAQGLSSLIAPPDFETDTNQSTPLVPKGSDKAIGFEYLSETKQEVKEIPSPATVSIAPYPVSQRPPYQQHPDNIETLNHVQTVTYTDYPPNTQINLNGKGANGTSHFSPANHQLITKTTTISTAKNEETAPYQGASVNVEQLHHARRNAPYSSSKQHYQSDLKEDQASYYTTPDSHHRTLPNKHAVHSETEFSKTVTLPAKRKVLYHYDPEIIDRSYDVEDGSYNQYSPQHVFSSNNVPQNNSHTVDANQMNVVYDTRSGSCPPYNIKPNKHRQNKIESTRTVTYSSENIAPYPMSIRVANSVELIPSGEDSQYQLAQGGKYPFKKQPSQVSLYDNM